MRKNKIFTIEFIFIMALLMSNVSTSSGNTEPKSSTKHECGSDNASEKADGSSQSKAAISKAVANRAAHAPYC